jgi:hypothetical protein
VRREQMDAAQLPGFTSEEPAEIIRLRRDVAELRRPTDSSRRWFHRVSDMMRTARRGSHVPSLPWLGRWRGRGKFCMGFDTLCDSYPGSSQLAV